jgi:hypothetical protein
LRLGQANPPRLVPVNCLNGGGYISEPHRNDFGHPKPF